MLSNYLKRHFCSSLYTGGNLRATTILNVRKDNQVALIGDGQVSLGPTVFKTNAKKIRRITSRVTCGFAGATADCLTLLELLEKEFEKYPNQTLRACLSLAKKWRTNKLHRHLSCDMLVCDGDVTILLNGFGDAIEIDQGAVAIGSGGLYAQAAAKALLDVEGYTAEMIARKAMDIAADLCVYTNKNFEMEVIEDGVIKEKK